MSLLLDALKKAAKDKEAKSAAAGMPKVAESVPVEKEDEFEFSLEDVGAVAAEISPQVDVSEPDKTVLAIDEIRPTPNTVSDEALQVLIYKTNHTHKRKRWLIWGSATAASVIVLVVSGIYFFNTIQQQVSMLERRHRANMQIVQAEPVKTALADQELKPPVFTNTANAKTITTKAQASRPTTARAVTRNRTAVQQHIATNQIQVMRGEKADPIGALLAQAWADYNRADYDQARQHYAQVLDREINNRDALMGMGAIAVNKNDYATARQYYDRLLQLDPQDPVANAALMNMNTKPTADSLSESKLLQLIQQNPAAADLHYALGNKYAAQSLWPEAQAEYFKAFEHDSTSADYAFNLAVSLERISRPAEAARYYRHAVMLANNSNVSFSLGIANQRLQHLQAATQP